MAAPTTRSADDGKNTGTESGWQAGAGSGTAEDGAFHSCLYNLPALIIHEFPLKFSVC